MVDTPYATNGPLPAPASPGATVAPTPAGPAPTPGPWRWRLDDYGGVEIDAGPREAPVAIAQVSEWREDATHRQARGEAVANACLIAAAPELLAAARLAQSAMAMPRPAANFASYRERAAAETAARDALAAAIARAEGRISSQEGGE